MGQPLGRIIKQSRTFYIATTNRVGGKQQLSSFCFPEDERQSKLIKLETSLFEIRHSNFEPRTSLFVLRYSKFEPRNSNLEPRTSKHKRSPSEHSPKDSSLLKTAATYSPTGVQYHRRGRA